MPKQRIVEMLEVKKVHNRMRQMGTRGTLVALAFLGSVGAGAAEVPNLASGRPDFESRAVEVHKSVNSIGVELNAKTVLCSRADYAMPMLKVLIPELAGITLLDHQNTGAGAPCVTTGQVCDLDGAIGPDLILQGKDGREQIQVEVKADRIENVDHQQKKCQVNLREEVTTVIRGQKLTHERWADLGERSYADCVAGVTGGAL